MCRSRHKLCGRTGKGRWSWQEGMLIPIRGLKTTDVDLRWRLRRILTLFVFRSGDRVVLLMAAASFDDMLLTLDTFINL